MFTIVTPSYNQGKYIEQTILSVKQQAYPYVEHIIVDGGSSDNTLDILKRYEHTYNMQWICEPDRGQADAVNKGFSRANGQIIGWLNADDIYFHPAVFKHVARVFQSHGAKVVFGNDALISASGRVFRVRSMSDFSSRRMFRNKSISQPATFFHHDIIRNYLLNPELHFAMDLEFFLRIGRSVEFFYLDEVLAGNRIHRDRKVVASLSRAQAENSGVREAYGFDSSSGLSKLSTHYSRICKGLAWLRGLFQFYTLARIQPQFEFIAMPNRLLECLRLSLARQKKIAATGKAG